MTSIVSKINKIAPIISLCAALFGGLVSLWCISLGSWGYAIFNMGMSVINLFPFLFTWRNGWKKVENWLRERK